MAYSLLHKLGLLKAHETDFDLLIQRTQEHQIYRSKQRSISVANKLMKAPLKARKKANLPLKITSLENFLSDETAKKLRTSQPGKSDLELISLLQQKGLI